MKEKANKLGPFQAHGVDVDGEGDNIKAACPFCEKEDHFFVDPKTGCWDCKHCGLAGNIITFLGRMAEHANRETEDEFFDELAKRRGVPAEAFKTATMGYRDPFWLIPVYSDKETVRDIRMWDGKRNIATKGCELQLYGLRELAKAPSGSKVWVCEGEWDAIALRWLLRKAGRPEEIVTAVPGATVFKEVWCNFYKGHHLVVCGDSDAAGDSMNERIGNKLRGTARSIRFVNWLHTLPSGYDLNDFISDRLKQKMKPASIIAELEKLVRGATRTASLPEKGKAPQLLEEKGEPPLTFAETMAVFRKWVLVDDDFERGLAISLATCLANDVPGDPLWIYLIGPPGSGKTVILLSLKDTNRTIFRSSLTPANLISGFQTHPDPSLLPKLDGKTAIFKDGTELLSMHPEARKQAYGILRGAYDGQATREWGNGVFRDYKVHFNMIIGVTPMVHGDTQSVVMGERFLKFEMREDPKVSRAKMEAAISNISKEIEMEDELATACRRFLSRKIDSKNLRKPAKVYTDRIITLAQLVSVLRAQVDREGFGERDVKYRPVHEIATRVAKQLSKLANMLMYVYDEPLNEHIYRLVRRVAVDTCIGFHVDIVRAIVRSPKGLTREQIGMMAKMSRGTLNRRLDDMEQLCILRKVRMEQEAVKGPAPMLFNLTEHVKNLWLQSMPATKKGVPRETRTENGDSRTVGSQAQSGQNGQRMDADLHRREDIPLRSPTRGR